MNVFDLFARISLDSSSFEKGISGALVKANLLSDAIKAGGKAIVDFVGSAVNSYAEYEQLVGGVETLFGESTDAVKEYAEQAYATAGMSANKYMETVTSFAASLLQSTKNTVEALTDEEIEARQSALDEQYEATKDSYSEQLDALKDMLSDEYTERKQAFDDAYDALSEALDLEIEEVEKTNSERLESLKAEQEAEVEAYEKATEERIALINKEYQESLKLVNEEEYNRIQAIDSQIAAINAEAEAEKKAQKKAEQEQKKAELQKAINSAESVEERQKAQEAYNTYVAKLEQEALDEARKAQIQRLKDRKDAVKEETSAQKEALKAQYDERLSTEKEASKNQLAEMKNANALEVKALQEAQKEQTEELKKAKTQQLKAVKESQEAQLTAIKRGQDAQIKAVKAGQDQRLKALKEANAKEKEILKSGTDPMAEVTEALGTDTKKAADIANMAIIDMSDNANKMGTSMQSIQNAYQGFAKQNYTMLDNLKLGYGGTKTEMERLLSDAEKISGIHYDISSLTDVFSAIHEIQSELYISGLTTEQAADLVAKGLLTEEEAYEKLGTTAKEATSTIEGSSGRLAAAWENLIVGFARSDSDIDTLINNVISSAETLFTNMLPTIERALGGIAEGVKKIAPIIGQKLPEIIIEIAPDLLNAGIGFITGIAQGIKEGFPVIVQSIEEKLPELQEKLSSFSFSEALNLSEEDMKRFAEAGESIRATWEGALLILEPALNDLAIAVKSVVDKFKAWGESGDALKTVTFVINAIIGLISAVIAILSELAAAYMGVVNTIIEYNNKALQTFVAVKDGIAAALEGLVTFYTETLPWALQKFGETLISIGDTIRIFFTETIPEWLNTALEFIQNCINNIVAFFTESLPNAIENFKTKLSSAGDSIRLFFTKSIPDWIDELFKKLKELPEKAMTFGKDFVEGLWNGIQDMGAWLKEKIEGFGEDVLGDLKDFFGIASPSKVMRDVIGKNLMLGLGEGIEDNEDDALTSALSAAESITKAFDLSSALGGLNPTAELSLATANTALRASTAQSGSTVPIVLNIDGRTLAKVLYPYNTAESQRRGLTIVTGG